MNGWKGSLGLALFGFLLILATPVHAAELAYLAEMPTPEQVIAKTTGRDPFDTSARQVATFVTLIRIMGDMQGNREFHNDRKTPTELSLRAAYVQNESAIRAKLDAGLPQSERTGVGSKHAQWYALTSKYEADPKFNERLLATFFSQDFRAAYAQAKAASTATVAAGAARLSGSSSPSQSSPPEPPAGPAVSVAVFAFVVAMILVAVVMRVMRGPYKLLTGKVNKLEHGTETSGYVQTSALSGLTYGRTRTFQTWSFRIDNQPVNMKMGVMGSLSEDDIVTAVGKWKNNGFEVIALRNEPTGGVFINSPVGLYVIGFLPIGYGWWATSMAGWEHWPWAIFGGLWMVGGVVMWNMGLGISIANNMLRVAPKATPVTRAV